MTRTEDSQESAVSRAALRQDARQRVVPVVDWLIADHLRYRRLTLLVGEFARRMIEVGLPLWRVSFSVRQLHPDLLARTISWDAEAGGATEIGRVHGTEYTGAYLDSPIRAIHEGSGPIRRKLEDPDCPLDFPIIRELKERGATDYYITLMPSGDNRPVAPSFATRRPGGFSDLDIAMIEAVLPTLSAVLELHVMRQTARTLLDTYVGPNTGSRILSGLIKRGDGEVINAVLWFCDLRNFTELSEELSLAEVIQLLNDYFEIVVRPIEGHGGEVLKFIGDAVLAIFPIEPEGGGAARAARQALNAARDALHSMARHDRVAVLENKMPIRCGIALHIGDVMYGNVGASSRLDFTVIGPAVNLVTRLEELTKERTPPLVLSADFAALCEEPTVSLGRFQLKGIARPQEALTLPLEAVMPEFAGGEAEARVDTAQAAAASLEA